MDDRILEWMIPEEMNGLPVRRVLKQHFHFASSLISRLKTKPDGICLNGEKVYTNAVVKTGDLLAVNITDLDPFNPAEPREYDLDIRYEDADLLVIHKPASMAVHGSDRLPSITVANACSWRYGQDCSFHPAHRLDKGTSGLLVIAKSAYVHDRLRARMHSEDFERSYLAVIDGVMDPRRGTICKPISREPVEGIRRTIDPDGLPSETRYETIQVFGDRSLVDAFPVTGRTHQIRIHFSSCGHPLLGDPVYGTVSEEIRRPALHSHRIHLIHPVTGDVLDLEDPLPEDMESLLR